MNSEIIKLILLDADKEKHPDRVACIYSVLMNVSMAVCAEMEKIRSKEREIVDKL